MTNAGLRSNNDFGDSVVWANWWLRSPGNNTNNAANVNTDGSVNNNGNNVNNDNNGVRPALHPKSVVLSQVRHACTDARELDSFSGDDPNPWKTLAGEGWDAHAFQTLMSKGISPVLTSPPCHFRDISPLHQRRGGLCLLYIV